MQALFLLSAISLFIRCKLWPPDRQVPFADCAEALPGHPGPSSPMGVMLVSTFPDAT